MKVLERTETIFHIVEHKNNTYTLCNEIWIGVSGNVIDGDLKKELDEEFIFLEETKKHTNYIANWWMGKSWKSTKTFSSYSKEDFYKEYEDYYIWAKEYFKRTGINHFLELGKEIEHPFELTRQGKRPTITTNFEDAFKHNKNIR
jgi:hypothetical protein